MTRVKGILTVNKRHAWTIRTGLANTIKVPVQKLVSTNLQALLNDLGSVLVHTVLHAEAEDMVDGTTAIGRCTMFTHVLDAPVSKLPMSNDIDAGQYLVYAGTLSCVSVGL